jgi:hypothetical protein
MSLKEKIQADINKARKARTAESKDELLALTGALSALIVEEKKEGKELSAEDEIKILNKKVKDHMNSIEMFENADRLDLMKVEKDQVAFLNRYLPQALNSEEISKAITEIISSNNYKKADMGKVMKDFTAKYAGRADGKIVSNLVKSILQ